MPRWPTHRKLAHSIGIRLSDDEMKAIDSKIDGFEEGYVHDSWRSSISDFKTVMNWAESAYEKEGVKYCLFHVVLDEAEEEVSREWVRGSLQVFSALDQAIYIAYKDTFFQEYRVCWDELLSQLKGKEQTLQFEMAQTPEVESKIEFKRKLRATESLARQYPNAKHFQLPTYMCFIQELQGKKRGKKLKDEWTAELIKKYCSSGFNNETKEKMRADFVDIAERLGYI